MGDRRKAQRLRVTIAGAAGSMLAVEELERSRRLASASCQRRSATLMVQCVPSSSVPSVPVSSSAVDARWFGFVEVLGGEQHACVEEDQDGRPVFSSRTDVAAVAGGLSDSTPHASQISNAFLMSSPERCMTGG